VVKLYLDEDVQGLLAVLLRAKNIQVETTQESKMLGKDDRQQLEYAMKTNATMVTHNRVDFENLFTEYIEKGKTLQGIIVLIRKDVYQMAKRLSKFILTPEDFKNRLWYV